MKKWNLYGVVNTIFLACAMIFSMGNLVGVFHVRGLHLIGVVVLTAVITAIAYFFQKRKILTVVSVVVFILLVFALAGFDKTGQFFVSYGKWATGAEGWNREWIAGYQLVQVLWIVTVAYALQKDFRVKLAATTVFIGMLAYNLFAKHSIPYLGVVICACHIAFVIMEWVQIKWEKKKTKALHVYMMWMLPFILLFGVLMYQMPVSDKAYDWQFVKSAYEYLEETVIVLTDRIFKIEDEYDTKLSGFSEDANLAGNVAPNDKIIMRIQSYNQYTNIFLVGKSFNHFDGRQWVANQQDFPKSRYIDAAETRWAVMSNFPGYTYNYLRRADITITHQELRTDYVFLPLKLWRVDQPFNEEEGSLLMEESQGYGFSYKVKYDQLNVNAQRFYNYLSKDLIVDPAVKQEVLSELAEDCGIVITDAEIEAYKKAIYEDYLECPPLSEEVTAYVDEITADCENEIERLRAIEAELDSYTYTVSPGEMPDTVVDASTYLDYFLLESKKGYCTYYATAFVLLARAEGIPARYVQGYCVPFVGSGEHPVTESMAHAWPEVYIEGAGWVPFEPTPGYATLRYTPWATVRETDLGEDAGESVAGKGGEGYEPEEKEMPEEKKEDVVPEESGEGAAKALVVAGMILLVPTAIFAIVWLAIRAAMFYRFRKKSQTEQYRILVRRNLVLLNMLGTSLHKGETLTEFYDRIDITLKQAAALRFIKDYESVIYGNRLPEEKVFSVVEEEQKDLEKVLKERNRSKYIWYKMWKTVYGM